MSARLMLVAVACLVGWLGLLGGAAASSLVVDGRSAPYVRAVACPAAQTPAAPGESVPCG